jgi:hypothetical protein
MSASFLALWCAVSVAGSVCTADDEAMTCVGEFEVGFRYVDVGGNEDKYREDVNYTKGPRLFKLDLNLTPGAGAEKFFDLLNFNASNLGGDPYEHFGITIKKYRKYNLRYTRNRLTYFYKDIIKPVEESTLGLSDAGDFHQFNFEHSFHRMDFDFRVVDRAKVFFNFDRQYKQGLSSTTRDVSRDEFELEKPLEDPRDDIKNDYTVGAEIWFDKVTLYVDETYRDYENNQRVFLPGFSTGEDPEDQTELLVYDQRTPVSYKMPQTTVRANIRPHDRVTLNAGYVNSLLNADLDFEQTVLGTDYQGNPVDTTTTGTGDFDRTIHMFNADAAVDVNSRLAVIGGFTFKKFDQEGSLTIEDEETSVDGDFESVDFDVGARVPLHHKVTVSGGVSYEERDVTGFVEPEDGQQPEFETTQRTSVFLSADARIDPRVNVFGEYERGFYDNPFTLISPSDLARYEVRLRAKITPEASVVATFLRREIENDISEADLTTNSFSVRASYKMAPVKIYAAFSRIDIDNEVRNEIETLPGFGGGVIFDWNSLYEAGTNQILAGIVYDVHETVSMGFRTNYYTNTGTFELDKQEYSLYSLLKSPSGYLLRVGYDREDYNEDVADFDDYDANIVTVGVGYGFGN